MSFSLKNTLKLFFLGFVLGPIGDYCHVLSRTNGYPQHIFRYYFLGVPFWVPFLFGTATLAIGLSHPSLDVLLGAPRSRPGSESLGQVAYGMLAFLALYAVSGFLPFKTGGFNDLIMALGALVVWLSFDRTWQGLLMGVFTACLGTLAEISLVKLGAFFYLPHTANLWGVPSWLPWLYVAASVTVGNMGRFLKYYEP